MGQEPDTRGVGARLGEFDSAHPAQQGIGHLDQDSGSVAAVGLASRRSPVFQILQCRQCLLDDVVRRDTAQGRYECDTAGIALELRVIQALPGRGGGVSVEERHGHSFVVGG